MQHREYDIVWRQGPGAAGELHPKGGLYCKCCKGRGKYNIDPDSGIPFIKTYNCDTCGGTGRVKEDE